MQLCSYSEAYWVLALPTACVTCHAADGSSPQLFPGPSVVISNAVYGPLRPSMADHVTYYNSVTS